MFNDSSAMAVNLSLTTATPTPTTDLTPPVTTDLTSAPTTTAPLTTSPAMILTWWFRDQYFYDFREPEQPGDNKAYAYYNVNFDWRDTLRANLRVLVMPIIIVIGLVGNFLTVCVLSRKSLRSMPSRWYFMVISLVDTTGLAMLMEFFIVTRYDRHGYASGTMTTVSQYIDAIVITASAWMVVALTIDRFVCVVWALKAHLIRPRHRITVSVIVVICSLLLNMDVLITTGYGSYYNGVIKPLLGVTLNFLVPLCIVVICNIGMIRGMKAAAAAVRSGTSDASSATNYLTRMSIVISTVFIISHTPKAVADFVSRESLLTTSDVFADSILQAFLSDLGQYCVAINYALNFYIYCLTGAKFRASLSEMFRCR